MNLGFYFLQNLVLAVGEESLTGIDLTVEGVFNIIAGLACWLTRIVVPIMVVFVILAGLRFMHSRGNPKLFQSAKNNFVQMFIGLLVIMGVYYIIATVANAVGVTDFSFIPLLCN
ncbi:MAG: hypothetical protein HYT65_03595 [Candidatus Yanofskybacteria bacterium]|nr:hypothetical protein [Candidatus Yanofskybacteria bacterium]